MKYATVILTSFLLWGVCSGKALEKNGRNGFMKMDETENSGPAQRSMSAMRDVDRDMTGDMDRDMTGDMDRDMGRTWEYRGGKMDTTNMDNSENTLRQDNTKESWQWTRKSQEAFSDMTSVVKGYVWQKIGSFISELNGQENSDDSSTTVYSNEIPPFADPLDVGSFNDKQPVATTQYRNVLFYGLNSAYQYSYHVDTQSQKVIITIPLQNVQVKGEYTVSNLLRQSMGNFEVALSGDVSYVQTVFYEYKDGEVYLGESNGQIQYTNAYAQYENIGFFREIFQGVQSRSLIQSIGGQVYEEVNEKLANQIKEQIKDVSQNLKRAKVVSAMQRGINNTILEIRKSFIRRPNTMAEMLYENRNQQHFHYGKYYGKLTGVYLSFNYNFNLTHNKVTYTNNKVYSRVKLSLPSATALASIQYHEGHEGQNHMLNMNYNISHIEVELYFVKEIGITGLQLQNVKVYVKSVYPDTVHSSHGGELNRMVGHLTSDIQSYLSGSLENFIKSETTGILGQDLTGSRHSY